MRPCFSMVELVFVIVIIGILSAVAVPKIIVSREDACIVKMRSAISDIESTLNREGVKYFLQGKKIPNDEEIKILRRFGKYSSSSCKIEPLTNLTEGVTFEMRGKKFTLEPKKTSEEASYIFNCKSGDMSLCKKVLGTL